MPNSKVKEQKAVTAYTMALGGLKDGEIAQAMQVSERTVRRWRAEVELPAETEEALVGLSKSRRAEFVEKAYPLVIQLLDVVEARIRDDDLTARDAGVLITSLVDKIRSLGPPPESITETTQETRFIMRCSDDVVEEKVQRRLRELTEGSEVVEDGEVIEGDIDDVEVDDDAV